MPRWISIEYHVKSPTHMFRDGRYQKVVLGYIPAEAPARYQLFMRPVIGYDEGGAQACASGITSKMSISQGL